MHSRTMRGEILGLENVADPVVEVRQVVVHQRTVELLANSIHKA